MTSMDEFVSCPSIGPMDTKLGAFSSVSPYALTLAERPSRETCPRPAGLCHGSCPIEAPVPPWAMRLAPMGYRSKFPGRASDVREVSANTHVHLIHRITIVASFPSCYVLL